MREGKEGAVKEEGAVVGHLEVEMKPRRKMKMWVLAETKGMRVSTAPVIKKFGEQRGRGRRRGKGSGRGGFRGTCFHCNEEGHRAFECPQRQGRTDRRAEGQARVAHVDEDEQSSHSEDAERGEVLVNERILLSGETEPGQRRSLFRTRCKC